MFLLIIKTLLIISLIGDLNGKVMNGTKEGFSGIHLFEKNFQIAQNSMGNYLIKKCK